jgi:hypothetical protein
MPHQQRSIPWIPAHQWFSREISELLHSGESALLIVAVNHKDTDITPLLENAGKKTVVETKAGDLDAAFEDALKKAQAGASRGRMTCAATLGPPRAAPASGPDGLSPAPGRAWSLPAGRQSIGGTKNAHLAMERRRPP